MNGQMVVQLSIKAGTAWEMSVILLLTWATPQFRITSKRRMRKARKMALAQILRYHPG